MSIEDYRSEDGNFSIPVHFDRFSFQGIECFVSYGVLFRSTRLTVRNHLELECCECLPNDVLIERCHKKTSEYKNGIHPSYHNGRINNVWPTQRVYQKHDRDANIAPARLMGSEDAYTT